MIRTPSLAIALAATLLAAPAAAQTITVVGTPHLNQLDVLPSTEQLAHTVEALAAFEPTQVCVEAMSGERLETLAADPARNGPLLGVSSFAGQAIRIGSEQQLLLGRRAAQARDEADGLVGRWDELTEEERVRAIGLQLAGFELPSAVLNWSRLGEQEREAAGRELGSRAVDVLEGVLDSGSEISSLAVALARSLGFHELCTADSLEDEARGVSAAMTHGGQAIIDEPGLQARLEELRQHSDEAWRPSEGPAALTRTLRFYNSPDWAETDRELQWETLHTFDNEAGAFRRRLMFWHARTAEISAELFRALARGPDERVLFIVGAAHRPFTEADLRAQPWVEVVPAESWLGTGGDAVARPPAARDDAEDGIRRTWTELDRHWNQRDAEAFAALFDRGASFVFVDRRDALEGREAILARFSDQFPTMAPELRHRTTVGEIRTLADDVRFLDGRVEILSGGEEAAGPPEILVTFAISGIMVPDADEWRIRTLRVVELPEDPGT